MTISDSADATARAATPDYEAAAPLTHVGELDAIYTTCSEASLVKETERLAPAYRAVVERAPLAMLATVGEGRLDISPRGDAPGFVHVVHDRLLALPDRRGNNRIDSLRNIVADPRVSLLFVIPGVNETLRIRGLGRITADEAVCAAHSVQGKLPATVLLIDIERVYFQCARAFMRAQAWDPAGHARRKDLPSAGEMLKQAHASFDAESYDAALPARQSATLY
ncbi:pyridoxamine 5'-phosphate oxidase family protein [Tepidamorphus sp. 3E244]|uniref:pyridoxamine 5'-phosphate oxidase family protein n=1 Tax=Tepidamorphus sp. 3E244 TaxID=3385498 RepID=UPI0038FD26FD